MNGNEFTCAGLVKLLAPLVEFAEKDRAEVFAAQRLKELAKQQVPTFETFEDILTYVELLWIENFEDIGC